ncbi:MAG: hypothetical protein LBU12_05620 [Deltaproteobacteria bacterium]|jgi:tetratricopeptide (TPR) repeat protein|nr:hypothetical protein [Deltaproteobacteria bacterium]
MMQPDVPKLADSLAAAVRSIKDLSQSLSFEPDWRIDPQAWGRRKSDLAAAVERADSFKGKTRGDDPAGRREAAAVAAECFLAASMIEEAMILYRTMEKVPEGPATHEKFAAAVDTLRELTCQPNVRRWLRSSLDALGPPMELASPKTPGTPSEKAGRLDEWVKAAYAWLAGCCDNDEAVSALPLFRQMAQLHLEKPWSPRPALTLLPASGALPEGLRRELLHRAPELTVVNGRSGRPPLALIGPPEALADATASAALKMVSSLAQDLKHAEALEALSLLPSRTDSDFYMETLGVAHVILTASCAAVGEKTLAGLVGDRLEALPFSGRLAFHKCAALYHRIAGLLAEGDLKAARRLWLKAEKLRVDDEGLKEARLKCLRELFPAACRDGRERESKKMRRQLLQSVGPDELPAVAADCAFTMSSLLGSAGRLDAAKAVFEEMAAEGPADLRLLRLQAAVNLAINYGRQGLLDEAERLVLTIGPADPELDVDALKDVAAAGVVEGYLKAGRYDRAVEYYRAWPGGSTRPTPSPGRIRAASALVDHLALVLELPDQARELYAALPPPGDDPDSDVWKAQAALALMTACLQAGRGDEAMELWGELEKPFLNVGARAEAADLPGAGQSSPLQPASLAPLFQALRLRRQTSRPDDDPELSILKSAVAGEIAALLAGGGQFLTALNFYLGAFPDHGLRVEIDCARARAVEAIISRLHERRLAAAGPDETPGADLALAEALFDTLKPPSKNPKANLRWSKAATALACWLGESGDLDKAVALMKLIRRRAKDPGSRREHRRLTSLLVGTMCLHDLVDPALKLYLSLPEQDLEREGPDGYLLDYAAATMGLIAALNRRGRKELAAELSGRLGALGYAQDATKASTAAERIKELQKSGRRRKSSRRAEPSDDGGPPG